MAGLKTSNVVWTTPVSLGATCHVVASDAKAEIKAWAEIAQTGGQPVWVCDGTADNVEIQAAITALTSGRTQIETVKLAGDFNLTAAISLPSYTRLDLTEARLFLVASSNVNMINGTAGSYEEIIGGMLDGNKANQASTSRGIQLDSGVSCVVRDVSISNTYSEGIYFNGGSKGIVKGNTISGAGARAITFDAHTYGWIVNNQILSPVYDGILLNTASNKNIVANNVIYNAGYAGIFITGSSHNVTVKDNIIDTTQKIGIWVDETGGNYAIIVGNYIYKGGQGGIAADGIGVGGNGHVIANNTILESYADGIAVGNVTVHVENVVITGNRIVGANTAGQGIMLANTYYGSVLGNVINTIYQDGIRLVGSKYIILKGNSLMNCSRQTANTYNGIFLTNNVTVYSTNNIIEGNHIWDTDVNKAAYGIRENSANDGPNLVMGNDVASQVTATISVQHTGSKVRNNAGYVTENSSTATVANGATTVVVNHGLATTPTRVLISLTNNPTNDPQVCWVDTLTTTQFTIKTKVDPGATGAIFDWRAQVGEG